MATHFQGPRLLIAMALGASALRCVFMPSLDGLTGGSEAVDAGDASSHTEAGNDAAPDVGPVPLPDAGDAGRWCASITPAPFFCDDFDDQGPLTRWTEQYVRAGASLGRDSKSFRSAPNALQVLSPAASEPSSSLVRLLSGNAKSKVRIAYDMRIDERDPAVGYAEINYISFLTAGIRFSVYLRVFASANSASAITSEAYLADGGIPAHNVPLVGMPRFDVWTRVGVEVDLASSPRTLTATIDGKVAALQTLEQSLYAPGPVNVNLGIGYTGYPTTGAWRIRYDNVTMDWE